MSQTPTRVVTPMRELDPGTGDGRNPLREGPESPEAPGVYDWYHSPKDANHIPRARSLERRLRDVYSETDGSESAAATEPVDWKDQLRFGKATHRSRPPPTPRTPTGSRPSYMQPTFVSAVKRVSFVRRLEETGEETRERGWVHGEGKWSRASNRDDASEASVAISVTSARGRRKKSSSTAHKDSAQGEGANEKSDGNRATGPGPLPALKLLTGGRADDDDERLRKRDSMRFSCRKGLANGLQGDGVAAGGGAQHSLNDTPRDHGCESEGGGPKPKQPKPCAVDGMATDGKDGGDATPSRRRPVELSECQSDSGYLRKVPPPLASEESREEMRPNVAAGPTLGEKDGASSFGSERLNDAAASIAAGNNGINNNALSNNNGAANGGSAGRQRGGVQDHYRPARDGDSAGGRKKRRGLVGRFVGCFMPQH